MKRHNYSLRLVSMVSVLLALMVWVSSTEAWSIKDLFLIKQNSQNNVQGQLSAPENLQISPISCGTRVDISWNGVAGATHYKVYRSFVETGPYINILTKYDSDSATLMADDIVPVTSQGVYSSHVYYKFSAHNDTQNSLLSDFVGTMINPECVDDPNHAPPTEPPNMSVSTGISCGGTIDVYSGDPIALATGYDYHRARASLTGSVEGEFIRIRENDDSPQFVDLGLEPGKEYFYRGYSVNAYGSSDGYTERKTRASVRCGVGDDDDKDGLCEIGEDCYKEGDDDGDGSCELGEACYDATGDDDNDGVCEPGEACYEGGDGGPYEEDFHDHSDDDGIFPNYGLFRVKRFYYSDPMSGFIKDDLFLYHVKAPKDPENYNKVYNQAGNLYRDESDKYDVLYFPKTCPSVEEPEYLDSIYIEVYTENGIEVIPACMFPKELHPQELYRPMMEAHQLSPLSFTYYLNLMGSQQITDLYNQNNFIDLDLKKVLRYWRVKKAVISSRYTAYNRDSDGKRKNLFFTNFFNQQFEIPTDDISTPVDFKDDVVIQAGTTNISSMGECKNPQGFFNMELRFLGAHPFPSIEYSLNFSHNVSVSCEEGSGSGFASGGNTPANKANHRSTHTLYVKDKNGSIIWSGVDKVYEFSYGWLSDATTDIQILEYFPYYGMYKDDGYLDTNNPDFIQPSGSSHTVTQGGIVSFFNNIINSITSFFASNSSNMGPGDLMGSNTTTSVGESKEYYGLGPSPRRGILESALRSQIQRLFAENGQETSLMEGKTGEINSKPCFNSANPTNTGFSVGGCTNIRGLDLDFLRKLAEVRGGAKKDMIITGGTEWWLHGSTRKKIKNPDPSNPLGDELTERTENNTTHRYSKTVDIRKGQLLPYISKSPKMSATTTSGVKLCSQLLSSGRDVYLVNGLRFYDEDDAHFHVEGYEKVKNPCKFDKDNIEIE